MSFVTIGAFITAYGGTIAAVSAAVGAVGAYSTARSNKSAAEFNATIAGQRSEVAQQQGAANEDAQRRKAAMAIGTQAAGAADNGGLEGTNLSLLDQSATNAEMDALNIRYGAKLQSISAQDQQALSQKQADSAMTAGWLNAGAAALSSVGNYAQTGRRTGGGGLG